MSITVVLVMSIQPVHGDKKSEFFVNQNLETKIMGVLNIDKKDLKSIDFPNAFFKTYAKQTDYTIVGNERLWSISYVGLDPKVNYTSLKNQDNKKTIVVFPTFTSSAYIEPGFYTYYRNECDKSCLTVTIKERLVSQITPVTVQVLKLLGYSFITDIDIDKNPSILTKYDKVILLHNEYVTQKEFDAVTSHPNVVYLYPNALYAKIKSDYSKNTITLMRGHAYPSREISNGFGWKYDNSKYEHPYDNCADIKFRKINRGWILDCYPVEEILINKNILLQLRNL